MRRILRRTTSWLLWIVVAVVVLAPLFAAGGRVSVIHVSTLGRVLIAVVATTAGVSLVAWLAHTSKSGSVDSALTSLRQLQPGRWLARVLIMGTACALLVAFSAELCAESLIRSMPGEQASIEGRVVGTSRSGVFTRYCHYLVDVQLTPGKQVKICAEFGLINRKTPAGLENLKPGDAVVVSTKSTTLGTSAVIVR